MGDVVDLAQRRLETTPHLGGTARCMNCKTEWQAIAPIEAMVEGGLECPSCATYQGVFVGAPLRHDGVVWACRCGNDVFRIAPLAGSFELYCAHCGHTVPQADL